MPLLGLHLTLLPHMSHFITLSFLTLLIFENFPALIMVLSFPEAFGQPAQAGLSLFLDVSTVLLCPSYFISEPLWSIRGCPSDARTRDSIARKYFVITNHMGPTGLLGVSKQCSSALSQPILQMERWLNLAQDTEAEAMLAASPRGLGTVFLVWPWTLPLHLRRPITGGMLVLGHGALDLKPAGHTHTHTHKLICTPSLTLPRKTTKAVTSLKKTKTKVTGCCRCSWLLSTELHC